MKSINLLTLNGVVTLMMCVAVACGKNRPTGSGAETSAANQYGRTYSASDWVSSGKNDTNFFKCQRLYNSWLDNRPRRDDDAGLEFMSFHKEMKELALSEKEGQAKADALFAVTCPASYRYAGISKSTKINEILKADCNTQSSGEGGCTSTEVNAGSKPEAGKPGDPVEAGRSGTTEPALPRARDDSAM